MPSTFGPMRAVVATATALTSERTMAAPVISSSEGSAWWRRLMLAPVAKSGARAPRVA
jgi:hypothetical protein